MYDASDKKDIRRATKEAKLAQRQDQEIITQLMSTTAGRSWMLRKLEACHVFSSSFNAQLHFMAFSEGERNIGLQLLNDVMAACPDHYIQMMRERNERDQAKENINVATEAETTVLTQETTTGTEQTQTIPSKEPTTTEQGSDDEQESSLLNEGDAEPAEPTGKDGASKDKDKGPGAPEAYEAFKVPVTWEEKGLALDPKTIDAFTPLAKELGLSQEGAQKLIDFYTGVAEAHSDASEAASVQAVKDMRKEWRDEIKADKQVGHRLPEVKANMAKMFNAFIPQQGDPKVIAAATQMVGDFKKALDLTGAGDHPAFIRLFDAISQRFTEGSYVAGKGPSPGGQSGPGSKPESAAKALYPSLG